MRNICRSVVLAVAATVVLLATGIASGCIHTPPTQAEGERAAVGEKAADLAASMIGRPYRYRGGSPSGFDCSGLVQYSYRAAGVDVPHGTRELVNVSRSVGLENAQKGDLLFFTQRGRRYSHVGLYIGEDQFVHAPGKGGAVRTDSVNDPYWQKHYLDTRRLLQLFSASNIL